MHCAEFNLTALKTLLKCETLSLISKSGGGNSKVFCVEADGERWAVKSYPPHQPGQRDRLKAEVTAYQFLNQQQVTAVPFLKTFCETNRWLVMSWIEGCLLQSYTPSDLDQCLQFIRTIAALNSNADARMQLPQAAEACLSLTGLIQQIEQRFERLMALPAPEPALVNFLEKDFQPVFRHYQRRAREGYAAQGLAADQELPIERQSLIPADFGFHNAIRDIHGKLYFFDFDYFGWDEPVKLLADILWHPKMHFSEAQAHHLIQGLVHIYPSDALFLTRFSYTYPLFGLRWTLILLNEFIAAYWRNRQHAEVPHDQSTAKKIQLERAQALLIKVQQRDYAYE